MSFQNRPDRQAWALVAAFIGLQVLIKILAPDGLDLDSSEQAYFAQRLLMGYGTRQPPLYTWVLWVAEQGPLPMEVLLETMRFAVIGAWFLAVGWVVRLCTPSRLALAAVLVAHMSLGFVMWRVFDSLTHTMLAVLLVTLAGGALLRWWLSMSLGWAITAGVLGGLACLAKFNAGLWWGCALASAWLLPEMRARMLERRSLLQWVAALAAFGVVLLPYALWWVSQHLAASGLASQIVVPRAGQSFFKPALDMLAGIVEYLALGVWVLLLTAVIGRRDGRPHVDRGVLADWRWRWMALQSVLVLGVTGALLLATHASAFKGRWLWPVAPLLPFAVLWPVLERPRLPRRVAVATVVLAVIAMVVVGLRFFEPRVRAPKCENCWSLRPAGEMAGALKARYGEGTLYLTGEKHLAGMLISEGLPAYVVEIVRLPPPDLRPQRCVVVWANNGSGAELDEPPQGFLNVAPAAATALPLGRWPMPYAPGREFTLRAVEQACPPAVRQP